MSNSVKILWSIFKLGFNSYFYE